MDRLSPYKGLAPFEDSELDASFFFGRTREQEVITANLTAARLTLLYGLSGVGKSSILRAGVVRRLRALPGPLEVVVFDQWRDDPGRRLREAVAAPVGMKPEGSLADTLEAVCARLGGELYVILDGVEEYFVYHADDSKAGTFAADFPEGVTRPGLRAYFLVSLREDALAVLDRFKVRVPSLFANSLRLDHLDRAAAREAIVGPVEEYNRMTPDAPVEIEPGLVDAVLAQVARGKVDLGVTGRGIANGGRSGEYVETPYLSLVMERLWAAERESGADVLRLRTLESLGGAEQIVRDHLDDALAALSPEGQEAAAEMFNHLVTPSGTKIAHRVSDLEDYAGVGHGDLEPMLHTLTTERILRPIAVANGSSRYEIFHDVLADAVLAWRTAFHSRRELEHERAEGRKRMRRMMIAAAAALILVIVMAGVTIFALAQRSDALRLRGEALYQRGLAQTEAKRARARALSTEALSLLTVDPELSLLLGVDAARREPSPAVEDVLRQALMASHQREVLPAGLKHGKHVHAAFSPDGRLVATGGGNGSTRIFRVRDGKLLRTLRRHGRAVTSVAFNNDGTQVVSASRDHTARIWRVSDGHLLHVLPHSAAVTFASFSPDGSRVLTVSADQTAHLWDASTGAAGPSLTGHTGRIVSASFSPNGSEIVTASADTTARVWDGSTGAFLYALVGHTDALTSAAFSPDGSVVVTGSNDATARSWRDGRLELTFHQSTPVVDLAFSPLGNTIVSARSDGAIVIREPVKNGDVIVASGHVGAVTSTSFSPDGRWIVTASDDGTARVWKADTGRPPPWPTLRGHGGPVTDAVFSPDSRLVVTSSDDGTARIWDPGTAPQLRTIGTMAKRVNRVSLSPDGKLAAAASNDGTARIWRTSDWKPIAKLRHAGAVNDAEFNTAGTLVVTASADGTARLWARNGAALRSFPHGAAVRSASFSDDGTRIVTGSDDGSARIWRIGGSTRPIVLRHGAAVLAASFSPDGRRVVTAGGKVARLWRADGTLLRELSGHSRRIVDASFSHDGSKLVTASADHTARIWDGRTGKRLTKLVGQRAALTSAAFSPDDRVVVTTSRDNVPHTWTVATGEPKNPLRGHVSAVNDAAFSPDGRWIVTAGPSSAGLFQSATGARAARLYYDGIRPLTSVAFSSDDMTIVAGGIDGAVRAYRCDICGTIPALVQLAEKRLAATGRHLTPDERRTYLRG